MESPRDRADGGTAASGREAFWRYVCAQAPVLYMGLVFVTVLFVLNVLAVLLADQSPGAFAVSVLVFGLLALTGGGMWAVLWRCQAR